MKIIYISVIFCVCASCSSGPRAKPLDIPSAALSEAMQQPCASLKPSEKNIPADWWTLFQDEQLTEFIVTALQRNPTLAASRATIYKSLSSADLQKSNLYPNLFWAGDISKQKLSQTGIVPFNTNPQGLSGASFAPLVVPPASPQIPVYFTQYETELNFQFDFDIWGKRRSLYRAALGEVWSKMADDAFARLQLAIAVAQTYYQLQIDYAREKNAQELVSTLTEYENLVSTRLKGNLDTLQTLNVSVYNLTNAQQLLLQIQGDIAVRQHQLMAYLADDFEECIAPVPIELPEIPLPCDLPLHLLARRPDIAAQLALIQSAGWQIESAKAGFYPDFSITAIYGYQTIFWAKLFEKPSSFYNIDPAFSLPIFDGGRLVANLRDSEFNYDIAISHYNEMVLNAVKEVLDGISVLCNLDAQYKTVHNSFNQQSQIYQLTSQKRANNLSSGLDTLSAEANKLTARDQELVILGRKIDAMLALIKALGGGYE